MQEEHLGLVARAIAQASCKVCAAYVEKSVGTRMVRISIGLGFQ